MTAGRALRKLVWLTAAVATAAAAAVLRWPDSSHAMGTIRAGGGAIRHPAALRPGADHYQIVLTAPVVGRWRGDARISLEGGAGPLPFQASLAGPVVDLGLHHWPRLEGEVIHDLAPGDRIALWVSFEAATRDPVCGMACSADSLEVEGRCFCGTACRDAFLAAPEQHRSAPRGRPIRLVIRDVRDGTTLLELPIAVGDEGGGHGAHH